MKGGNMLRPVLSKNIIATLLSVIFLFGVCTSSGFAGQRKKHRHSEKKGAIIGGVAGFAGGALIGGKKGALIGAGAGAGTGYLIQRHRNRKQRR